MNAVNLTGNLCADPELKQTQTGKSVVRARLAVKRPFSRETTDFLTIVVWNQSAEYLSKYARKGSKIGVTGSIETSSYQSRNGENRTSFEIVCNTVEILESKGASDGAQGEPAQTAPTQTSVYGQTPACNPYTPPAQGAPNFEQIPMDDDLPF